MYPNNIIELLKNNKELYDLFTKQEEYNPIILDQYQRFPYYLSKSKTILEPKVSEFLIKNGLHVEYPEGAKFAVCLTHDIDVVNFSKLSTLKSAAKYILNKNWKRSWSFEEFMTLEEKYNAKSSFYFLALNKGDQDFNFRVEDLKHELANIVDNGWEVGLHGGHKAYIDINEIIEKKRQLEKVLGKEVIGYRNHYLRFKVPDTWELLRKAGFKYDTTFGYSECIGFRNGMCHPFKPFNLITNKEIDILEIPLTIMDRTLFDYMKLDMNERWEITKTLIDTVEKSNGIITILWHNTLMNDENLRFYEKILKYCFQKGAWMTSGEEIEKRYKSGIS